MWAWPERASGPAEVDPPLQFWSVMKLLRMDKHQQVTPFTNSQRSSFGGDTSVSSPKSLDAESDAPAVTKNKQFRPAVCATSVPELRSPTDP